RAVRSRIASATGVATGEVAEPEALRLVAKLRPKSRLLAELGLSALGNRAPGKWRARFVVAELLGEHFAGNAEILQRLLTTRSENAVDEAVIVALCEGWPDSE